MPEASTTAIVGVGNIGSSLARRLSRGGESIVLAAKDLAHAQALASELGPRVRAASVDEAIAGTNVIVLALWLDDIKEVIPQEEPFLDGKVVVDPSNPVSYATGSPVRTLPKDSPQPQLWQACFRQVRTTSRRLELSPRLLWREKPCDNHIARSSFTRRTTKLPRPPPNVRSAPPASTR